MYNYLKACRTVYHATSRDINSLFNFWLLVWTIISSKGGHKGFDKVIWEVAEYKQGENPSITFKYHSLDGEEGNNTLTHTNSHDSPHYLFPVTQMYVSVGV